MSAHPDTQHTDASAVAPPAPAAPVPAEELPRISSAGATRPPGGFGQCSSQIDAISAALAKAQGAISNPGKTALNPHFKSQYADLSSGLNAVRAALSSNAIAVVQTTSMHDDTLMLHTALCHSSGQWISSEWPVVKLPAAPQVIGSALTYARRYTLFALVGIAGEGDDDDGIARSASAKSSTNDQPGDSGLIDSDQLIQMHHLIKDTKSNLELFFLTIGATGFSDMTVRQWKAGMAKLREKQRRALEKATISRETGSRSGSAERAGR